MKISTWFTCFFGKEIKDRYVIKLEEMFINCLSIVKVCIVGSFLWLLVGITFVVGVEPLTSSAVASSIADNLSWEVPFGIDGAITSVSCGSQSFCIAVDDLGNALVYSGGYWGALSKVDTASGGFESVSCVETIFCAAVDSVGNAVEYNDSSWETVISIDGNTQINSVSCASSTFCIAIDNVGNVLDFNGSLWSKPVNIDASASLEAVSCASSTFCIAGDSNGNVLTFNGTAWSSPFNLNLYDQIQSVSCPSASFCVVADDNGSVVLFNGKTWISPESVDSVNGLSSISCISNIFCIGVDYEGGYVEFNGTSWSSPATIDSNGGIINSVSCVNSSFCIAGDGVARILSFDGSSWTQPNYLGQAWSITSISCPQLGYCIAVDFDGNAIIYQNGIWGDPVSVDPGGGGLTSVSCPTITFCVAVDFDGNALTFDGTSWSAPVFVDNSNASNKTGPDITSVSCPTTTFCVAVDFIGDFTVYDGTSWSTAQFIDTNGHVNYSDLTSVSCSSSNFCIAVDNFGNYLLFDGSSWSLASNVDSFQGLTSISCPSSNTCFLADSTGHVVEFNGGWGNPKTVDSNGIDSISCPTTTFCMVVDYKGNSVVYGGGVWSAPIISDGTNTLNSVSCPLSEFCWAVDESGMVFDVAPIPTISSITPNSGISTGGNIVTITGSGFSTVHGGTTVNFGNNPSTSVSCSSTTSCSAVVPPGTVGQVNVNVKTTNGTTSTGVTYTYATNIVYIPITPLRVCDTRTAGSIVASNQCNNGTASNGTMAAGSTININVTGTFGTVNIPSNATAVVLNVTATNTTQSGGFLTVYPTGSSRPNSSNLNFNSGDTVPNLVQVGVGVNQQVSIYNFNGSTDVIVDLEGYFIPTSSSSTSGEYVPISPVRVCDTRPSGTGVTNNQCDIGPASKGSIGASSVISVNVAGSGSGGSIDNIPSNATAVVLNVTATDTTSNGGFLTIYPTTSTNTPPTASNLNFNVADTVANRVIVPIGTNGDISIYNYNGDTDTIVDVNGYFLGSGSSTTGSSFTPIVPVRVCDTRAVQPGISSNQCNTSPNTTMSQSKIMTVNVAGSGSGGSIDNIPSNATAVVLNVTATNTTSNGGFLTIYPTPASGPNVPNISDINWNMGNTVANLVVVKIGSNDSINIYNAIGNADVMVDVMGYYG